ncbi:hypothetical protein BX600DRAFT_474135 [Xylariales sp. PMI_506]|nr:hypothetical protein BX600DRAFT_474135 [Xylariales sp. PMI_506]
MGFLTTRRIISKVGKGAATKQLSLYENLARWAARGVQLVFGLIVLALYGHRVDEDHKSGSAQAAAWVFAVAVSALSCLTCIAFCIPFLPAHRLFAWDLFLFVLWIAVFGTFADIFLHNEAKTYEGVSVALMKVAVWVDLVNCVLWLATGAYGSFRTFVGRKVRSVEDKIDGKLDSATEKIKNKAMDKAGSTFGIGQAV